MTEVSPTQPTPSSEVFISYASQDKPVADAIVEALERNGIRCWIAPRDVRAGAQYADAIVRALSGAKAIVLVLSANAINSSHVGKEIERASSKKRPIIALRVDAAPLTPALEYFLSESQWIEAQAGSMEAAHAKLIDAIREPAHPAPTGGSASTPATPTPSSAIQPKSRRNRMLLAAGLAIVAVTLTALFAPKFWLAKHPSAEQPSLAATPTAAVSDKSIAVLPFVDMSEKHDQEYFGDGMADEVLNLLVKIPGLIVIGRTSSFQFKDKNEDLRTIGTQLNAAYVLEGSVRKSGDQVRVTAQLINARTGGHEWSETYDRPIGDVLKLQDTIAAAVVRELQLTVVPGYLRARSTLKDAEAYQLLLRGRHANDRYDREGLDEAVALFKQALDRDPTSGDAAAGLANAYYNQGAYGVLEAAVAFEKARRAAEVALRLDPNNGLSHEVLGFLGLLHDWDWAAAEREFHQAAMLAPGNAGPLLGEAWRLLVLGRWDEALSKAKSARVLDPLDPRIFECLTWIQMDLDHLADAEASMRRGLDIRPAYAWGRFVLGLVLLKRDDADAALHAMNPEAADEGQLAVLAMAYHALGRRADSDAALARLIAREAAESAFEITNVYAFRGQSDEAMRWLDRAYTQRDPNLFLIKSFTPLKRLSADPRYKAFLRKMNLSE